MSGENHLEIDRRYVLEKAISPAGGKISLESVSQMAKNFLKKKNKQNKRNPEIPIDSCDDICTMIDNSRVLDWLLYLTKKRYRDHFQHQFFVGTLGLIFLNTGITDGGKTLKKYMAEKLGIKDEESIEKSWWIASLLHDHAYPLAHLFSTIPVIGNYQKSFSELYNVYNLYDDELVGIFRDDRSSAIESLKRYLICFFRNDELSNLFGTDKIINDHGIWGAVNIIAHMKKKGWPFFRNSFDNCRHRGNCNCNPIAKDNNCQYYQEDGIHQNGILCLKQAIRAIAIHNCQDFGPVYLEEDPIAFLLILCDEMQEWDRKTMIGDNVDVESSYIELDGISVGADGYPKSFGEKLTIRFCFNAQNLVANDWDYKKFFESKREAFKRLKVAGDFPLKKIDFRIEVPYNIDFS